MPKRIVWRLLSAVLLLSATAAHAQLANFNPSPFSHYWRFGERPIDGPVAKIEFFREFKKPDGSIEKRKIREVRYVGLPDGGHVISEGPEPRPNAEITRDASGRILRVVSRGVQGDALVPFTKTEAATYDERGRLAAIYIEQTHKPAQNITFSYAPAGAGQTMSWSSNGWEYSMSLNAAGEVTGYSHKRPGGFTSETTLKRNQQGDVVSIASKQPSDEYEYEYDERGNWVRQVRYLIFNGKRRPGEVYVRQIQYGKPNAVLEDKLAANPKVVAEAPEIRPERLPGEYRNVLGEIAVMTVVLGKDKSARFSSRRTFGEQAFEDAAIGTWSVDGKVVVVSLEKSTTERPLPPEMRVIRFVTNASGDLVAAHDGRGLFKRAAETPPAKESEKLAATDHRDGAVAQPYKNEAIGYTVDVPSGWQLIPVPGKLGAQFAAAQRQGDVWPGKITLLGETLKGSSVKTVEQYAQLCRDKLEALVPKARFTDFKAGKLGGRHAISHSLIWDTPDLGRIEMFQIVAIVGDNALVINYMDDSVDYKQLFPTVQKCLDSLKFDEKK